MPDTSQERNPDAARILVSCSLNSPCASETLACMLRDLYESTLQRLSVAGVEVVFTEASAPGDTPSFMLAGTSGLLVLGGADADPALYGQRALVDTIYGVNRVADEYEIGLLNEAIARGLPVLGICRGMQLLNIARGGSLTQEIGPATMHYRSADNSVMTDHLVRVLPQTRLSQIYGEAELPVRSGHHQAVSELGRGLQITAMAADGVVEAIEAQDEPWVVGVQWHPEDRKAPVEHLDMLLSAFVDASRGI